MSWSHRAAHPMAYATHLGSRVPRHVTRLRRGCDACRWAVSAGTLVLIGCRGPQSALDPAGRGAERIAELFWWMATGAGMIWLTIVGLAIYAMRARPGVHNRSAALLIIGGGAILPTVVLAGLLAASPMIWAAHFLLSYITAAIWCAKMAGPDGPLGVVRVAIALYTVLALSGIGVIGWSAFHRHSYGAAPLPHDDDTPEDRHRFLGFTALLLSGLSVVAVLYAALAAVFIGSCD